MKFKNGTEEILKDIFSYTDDISVFKSRMSFDEFQKKYIEYSGKEAKTLVDYFTPFKCKRTFSLGRNDLRSQGIFPESFFKEWDSTTKHFKQLYLGKYLTQEFFETNPQATIKSCENVFKPKYVDHSSELYREWNYLEKSSRKLELIKNNYSAVEMLLLRIENCKKSNLLCDLEEVY